MACQTREVEAAGCGAYHTPHTIDARYRRRMRFRTPLNALTHPSPDSYSLVRAVFVRLLGVVYLIAFASFGVQTAGLVGSDGILPAAEFLERVREVFGAEGYRLVPTVFWLSASDTALTAGIVAGLVLSTSLIVGFLQRVALVALYALYLSFVSVGQAFMAYQWDTLLLEVGFLSIFLAIPGPAVVWLFRALIFRFWFLSGAVKLLSDDPTWSSLTALTYHYETQPLPTWVGWYAHHLPEGFHRFAVGGVFFVEMVAPFMVFGPRPLRFFAAACFTGLNVAIAVTGNYTFFNLLSIILCVFLLDDDLLRRLPERAVRIVPRFPTFTRPVGVLTSAAGVVAAFVLIVGGLQMWGTFTGSYPGPAATAIRWIAPFYTVNGYGLFAVMTTSRPEIVVQGSNDGEEWRDYEFKHKPGDLARRPSFVAPHQPRLDWQMWFAALSPARNNAWFHAFASRLLEGSPAVLSLMGDNPFPDSPPRYIRAQLYLYTFSDADTRRETGEWWQRRHVRTYFGPVELRR